MCSWFFSSLYSYIFPKLRPHYQCVLNLYPILSRSKQQQLEALNRKIFRIVNRWHDTRNIEVINLPAYKIIEHLTQIHFLKLFITIIHSNSSVIIDYIRHKVYFLFLKEYFLNPLLLKEQQKIVGRGRTSNRVQKLLSSYEPSLFDRVFCF